MTLPKFILRRPNPLQVYHAAGPPTGSNPENARPRGIHAALAHRQRVFVPFPGTRGCSSVGVTGACAFPRCKQSFGEWTIPISTRRLSTARRNGAAGLLAATASAPVRLTTGFPVQHSYRHTSWLSA